MKAQGRAAASEDLIRALCLYLKLDQYDLTLRFLRSMKVERAGYRDFLRTKKKESSDPYRGASGDPYAGGLPDIPYSPALFRCLREFEYHEVSQERWYKFSSPHLDLSCGVEVGGKYRFRLHFTLQLSGAHAAKGVHIEVGSEPSLAAVLNLGYSYDKKPLTAENNRLTVTLTVRPKAIGALPAEALGNVTVRALSGLQEEEIATHQFKCYAKITAPRTRASKQKSQRVRRPERWDP